MSLETTHTIRPTLVPFKAHKPKNAIMLASMHTRDSGAQGWGGGLR